MVAIRAPLLVVEDVPTKRGRQDIVFWRPFPVPVTLLEVAAHMMNVG